MKTNDSKWTARTLLIIATAMVVTAMFVPYGFFLVYPFRLFGTFIHEAAHAMAAVVSGGEVVGMHVNLDTSGLTLTRGGSRFLISSAGYMGSILVGAALLVAGRRRAWARNTLIVTGMLTLLATAFFGGYGSALLAILGFIIGFGFAFLGRQRALRSEKKMAGLPLTLTGLAFGVASLIYLGFSGALLTWTIGIIMGGACLVIALSRKPLLQHLTVIFLGVQVAADGLHSIQHLLAFTTHDLGHSDAHSMAELTGVPATAWAILWGVLGIMVIIGAFILFFKDTRKHEYSK